MLEQIIMGIGIVFLGALGIACLVIAVCTLICLINQK